jgi:hypothetical protein
LGEALYKLERVSEAKTNFQLALQSAALILTDDEDANTDGDRQSKEIECRKWLDICEEKLDARRKSKGTISEEQTHLINAATTATTTKLAITTKTPSRATIPKYQYYQNDNYVTVAILEPNANESDLKVEYGAEGMSLTVCLRKQGVDLTVICGSLFDSVNVENVKSK